MKSEIPCKTCLVLPICILKIKRDLITTFKIDLDMSLSYNLHGLIINCKTLRDFYQEHFPYMVGNKRIIEDFYRKRITDAK